ncbi:hypothetical protein A4X06_0g6560 [Tilletia controversa]|uniref:Carboxylic ester hydrolase n=4 Tax=Tilletia TaxID=13289 RepID=A0A8X7MNJ7_9BASI|nr:hypothetical protein A4X06_0g6560 [Tilletia controversa]CAD6958467.1 unnamed protein product [Tilletia caries]
MKGGSISFSLLCLFICTTLATLVTSRSISQRVPLRRTEGDTDPLLFVTTSSGQVRGKAPGSVYTYKGIPYGNPTSGSRRFRAPTMASRINAFIDNVAPPLAEQSEDCLSANVFVHGSTRAKASSLNNGRGGAAVMIWSDLFNAQNFVERQNDVIVVSFNYRTNIFGFPLSPQIWAMDASIGYNRGLEDRDLAVEWVHKNIARFGGDPDRITLFGQSAGGASVDTWAFANAKTANPLVKGLIVQSGAVQGLDLALGNQNPEWTRHNSLWNKLANHPTVECGLKSGLKERRSAVGLHAKVDFSVLLDAISLSGLDFGPAVDNKRYFDDWEGRSAVCWGGKNGVKIVKTKQGQVSEAKESRTSGLPDLSPVD